MRFSPETISHIYHKELFFQSAFNSPKKVLNGWPLECQDRRIREFSLINRVE